jgi:WD40 repeat protein
MLTNIRGHQGKVFAVAWSLRDENLVFSGGADQTVYMWDITQHTHCSPPDAKEFAELLLLKGHHDGKSASLKANSTSGSNMTTTTTSPSSTAITTTTNRGKKRKRSGSSVAHSNGGAPAHRQAESSSSMSDMQVDDNTDGQHRATIGPVEYNKHMNQSSSNDWQQCAKLARIASCASLTSECLDARAAASTLPMSVLEDDRTTKLCGVFMHGAVGLTSALETLEQEIAQLGGKADGIEQAAALTVCGDERLASASRLAGEVHARY